MKNIFSFLFAEDSERSKSVNTFTSERRRQQRVATLCFSLFFFFTPFFAHAMSVDIGFAGGTQDIFFSKEKLIEGEPVRIYARVHNFGNSDMSAQVIFYQSDMVIGEPQPISLRAAGLADEVYVDWVVPHGQFNIRTEVKAQTPKDENASNDTALTALLTPEKPLPPPPPVPTESLATSIAGGNTSSRSASSAPPTKKVLAKTDDVQKNIVLAPPTLTINALTVPKEKDGAVSSAPIMIDSSASDLLKVHIEFTQVRWNTFRFSVDANRLDGITYAWSFGDGVTAQGREVTHAYRFAGRYSVSVVALHNTGERAQEKITLDISFWHLDNWQLWVVFGVLVGFVALLLRMTRKEKSVAYERSAIEEGETPPVILQEEERESVAMTAAPMKKKRKPPVRKKKSGEAGSGSAGKVAEMEKKTGLLPEE